MVGRLYVAAVVPTGPEQQVQACAPSSHPAELEKQDQDRNVPLLAPTASS